MEPDLPALERLANDFLLVVSQKVEIAQNYHDSERCFHKCLGFAKQKSSEMQIGIPACSENVETLLVRISIAELNHFQMEREGDRVIMKNLLHYLLGILEGGALVFQSDRQHEMDVERQKVKHDCGYVCSRCKNY